MRRVNRDHVSLRTVGVALLLAVAARAAAQTSDTPVGLPAHEMLEDPFNRSVLFDELEVHDGDELDWDASAWLGYAFNRLTIRTEGERSDGAT